MWRYIVDLLTEIWILLVGTRPDKWEKIGILFKEIYYTIASKIYMYRYEVAQWLVIIALLGFLLQCGPTARGE